jgi:hypothetical protein
MQRARIALRIVLGFVFLLVLFVAWAWWYYRPTIEFR